jgi:hypothetical protein
MHRCRTAGKQRSARACDQQCEVLQTRRFAMKTWDEMASQRRKPVRGRKAFTAKSTSQHLRLTEPPRTNVPHAFWRRVSCAAEEGSPLARKVIGK